MYHNELPDGRVTHLLNGTYTMKNLETGEHRIFRIRTQPDDAKFAPGERVVALLTGPDNRKDFTGFGFVKDDGIRVWRRAKVKDAPMYAWMLWNFEQLMDRYEMFAEGRCLRCNRPLTVPESIQRGVGPVCAGA